MGRPLRFDRAGDTYHVYNRGARGQDNYEQNLDRRFFLHLVASGVERYDVEVLAYCLMTNHYHLMIRCNEACLALFMRDFTSVYVRRFNAWHGYSGSLWQDRYQPRLVDSGSYERYLSLYIHRNPRDLGWDGHLATYPWSSLQYYLRSCDAPTWLKPERVLRRFRDAADYAERVDDAQSVTVNPDAGPSEIAEAFAARSLDQIIRSVGYISGGPPELVVRSKAGQRNLRRCVAMVLSSEYSDLPGESLAGFFGFDATRTFRTAVRRSREYISTNETAMSWYHQAAALLM